MVRSGPTQSPVNYNLQGAQNGLQYVYARGGLTSTFGLETPPLSTAGLTNPILTFGRNGMGPYPGALSVQQEDPVNPGSWVQLATITGPTPQLQGNGSSHMWAVHQVPLLPSTGATARFRFIYSGTANSNINTVALDDVGICEL